MRATRPGPVEVKEGEEILAEGETGREMYVIEEGRVEIYRKSDGAERSLGVLEAGDFFGEMGLLDDQPRGASARAASDARLLLIDHTTFDQMLRQYPEVSIRIMRSLCQRLRAAAAEAPPPKKEPASEDVPGAMPGNEEGPTAPTASRPEPPAPPAEPAPPVTKPPAAPSVPAPGRLVAKPSGTEIVLPAMPEIRCGRYDSVTGTHPDVDLAPFDTKRTTSRRHAKIVREEGRLFVFEEIGTANGTFVNGTRIATGAKVEVRDGDEIRFGGAAFVLRTS